VRLRTAVDLGALLRDRRRRLGLSQAALARRVGVGREWIIEVEKGKSAAPLKLLLRALQALSLVLYAQPVDEPARKKKNPSRKNPGSGVNLDSLLRNLRRNKSS
jgi:HTH-type transcriptional regulator/antitoxin HipB